MTNVNDRLTIHSSTSERDQYGRITAQSLIVMTELKAGMAISDALEVARTTPGTTVELRYNGRLIWSKTETSYTSMPLSIEEAHAELKLLGSAIRELLCDALRTFYDAHMVEADTIYLSVNLMNVIRTYVRNELTKPTLTALDIRDGGKLLGCDVFTATDGHFKVARRAPMTTPMQLG